MCVCVCMYASKHLCIYVCVSVYTCIYKINKMHQIAKLKLKVVASV